MLPKNPPNDPAIDQTPEVSQAACPYCGRTIDLHKGADSSKTADGTVVRGPKRNASNMPMNQLRNVIKSAY